MEETESLLWDSVLFEVQRPEYNPKDWEEVKAGLEDVGAGVCAGVKKQTRGT